MTDEHLYFDSVGYFDQLMVDISQAREHIVLESYIFDCDAVGERICRGLNEAAARGVSIRVLLDGIGTSASSATLIRRLRGIEVRIFNPAPWRFDLWQYSVVKHSRLRRFWHFILHLNHRNHRKLWLIDDTIIWVGSLNVSRCHLPKKVGGQGWADIALRCSGASWPFAYRSFEAAWNNAHLQRCDRNCNRNNRIRLNCNRRVRRFYARDLLRRLSLVKTRIWIVNAYFVPDHLLLRRLIKAARRGVDVRILLPERSDVFFMPWMTSIFYWQLLRHGVKIFEFQEGMLHAKAMIIDDWMTVGSSNLNSRSWRHDYEIDAVVIEFENQNRLVQQFQYYEKKSRKITSNERRRPLWQTMIGEVLLFIKYWL